MNNNHLGRSPNFVKPRVGGPAKKEKDKEKEEKEKAMLPHFSLVHYAGVVAYNLSGEWVIDTMISGLEIKNISW